MPIFSKLEKNKLFLSVKDKIKNVPLLSSWRTILFLGISAVLIYYVISKLDLVLFWESLKKLSFFEFASLLFLSFFEFFLASVRYNLVGKLNIFSHFLDYISTTNVEKVIPPRPLGIYYRFVLTRTLYKLELEKTIFMIFIDTVFDMLYGLFGIIALIFVPGINFSFEVIFYIIAIAGVGYIAYVIYENYSYAKENKALEKVFGYFKDFFFKLKKSLFYFLEVKTSTVVYCFFLTIIRDLVNVLKVYLLFAIFGVEVSFLNSAIIYFIAYLIGSSSSLPGGVGAFELTFLFVAKVFGINEGVALTVAILERIFSVWIWALVTGAHLVNEKVGLINAGNRFIAKAAQFVVKVSKKSKTRKFAKKVLGKINKKLKVKTKKRAQS